MAERNRAWFGAVWVLLGLAALAVVASTTVGADRPSVQPVQSGNAGGALGGDSIISRVAYEGEVPAIAYNTDDEEYLVVWVEGPRDEGHILGQIYSAAGMAQGEAFRISADVGSWWPTAAYNAAHHQYLVVYHRMVMLTEIVGSDDVLGRIYSADGVPQGEEFPISSHGSQSTFAAVASSQGTEYLVVWNDSRGDTVCGVRVNTQGTLVDNPGTVDDESDPAVGFFVSTASEDYRAGNPALAYNEEAGEYLVVWERVGNGYDIGGQKVIAVDGSLQGGELVVSSNEGYQGRPAVAYNSEDEEYLVVWEDGRDPGMNAYGQRLATNGNLLDNPGTDEDETDPAVNFVICDAPSDQIFPAVTYNASAGQYLVVWHDERHGTSTGWDVYGQRVGANGALAEPGEFVISDAVGDQDYPAVASHTPTNTLASQYLVVWQDSRDGASTGVYAQRVWWPGHLLGHGFALAPPLAAQDTPAVAFDSTHGWYLAVWADARNGDYDIYGQLLDRDGVPMDEVFGINEGDGNQTEPTVVYNPLDGEYLVVWTSETGGNTWIGGQVVRAQGTTLGEPLALRSHMGSMAQPAIAHNSNPSHNDYLVVFVHVAGGSSAVDIRGWQVAASGEPASSGFVICDADAWKWNPDVAYSPDANEFLVTWQDERSGDHDIYARRVSASGALVDTEIVISDAANDQQNAALVYNPQYEEYLVVWEDDRTDDLGDIYAQIIKSTGVLVGGNITVPTTAAAAAQQHPEVVYVSDLNRYRIVWDDKRGSATVGWDIYAQWLSGDGTSLGTADAPIVRFPGDQQYAAIAYDPGYNQALAVWQDGRGGVDTDIYGSMGALDRDPPVARFVRQPLYGQVGQVFAFSAWPSTDDTTPKGDLRVRWDMDDDDLWDVTLGYQKFVTWTYSTTGTHTVTLEVWDEADQIGNASLPVYVYAPAAQLSSADRTLASRPTAKLVADPGWGAAGTTFAFDGSDSTGTGALRALWDWENDGQFDTPYRPGLSATHRYTVAGDYTVRLLIRDMATGLSDSAFRNITVMAGDPVDLEVSPHVVTMVPVETLQFRALAWDEYGNTMHHPVVDWSVTDSRAGEISATGMFTAGMESGVFTDSVRAESNGVTETASVTVTWPYQLCLPTMLK